MNNLYSKKCQLCQSPALINKSGIFCSNNKCLQNKYNRKKYYVPPRQPYLVGRDEEQFIICSLCSLRARDALKSNRRMTIYCPNYHSWVFEPTIGDKLSFHNAVYIYDGTYFVDESLSLSTLKNN